MYASVRRYRVEGSAEELAERVTAGLLPIFRENPGFAGYYVVNGGDGYLASVSVFESREAARQSSEQAAAWIDENASEYLPEAPEITSGEVLVAVTG